MHLNIDGLTKFLPIPLFGTVNKGGATPHLDIMQVHQLLASSLNAVDVGLQVWDAEDKLVLYNKKIAQMEGRLHRPENIGKSFDHLMRDGLSQGFFPAAIGCEDEWLSECLRMRASISTSKAPRLVHISPSLWVNIYESRTPEGYLVSAWVDVSDWVHKGQVLEASNVQLAQQSATDGLTGLANRRHFDEALKTEWLRAARRYSPLSLLMVDIDHFKRYNDHYGHLAGDECLRRVAQALSLCAHRAGELVARYGGEEFVILLPASDMTQACETAQRCLDQIMQEALPHGASNSSKLVTLSIGVACLQPNATLDASILLRAADAAMYRAKSNGRSCYQIAQPSDGLIDANTPLGN